jgi:hypothetical protein
MVSDFYGSSIPRLSEPASQRAGANPMTMDPFCATVDAWKFNLVIGLYDIHNYTHIYIYLVESIYIYICNMYYLPLISIYRHIPLIGDGMYHPLMLIWRMVYDFVYDIVFTLYHVCMYVCIYTYIPHIYKLLYIYVYIYMEVSWNGSIPKSSILKRVFHYKQSIWGPHIYLIYIPYDIQLYRFITTWPPSLEGSY